MAGSWSGLVFNNNADTAGATSSIQHCIIEKATRNLFLYSTGQPGTLSNLELRFATESGLRLEGMPTTPVLSTLNIQDNTQHSVLLAGCPLPTASGITRPANGENRFTYTGDIAGDLTFNLASYAYPLVFEGNTRVFGSAGPRLTLTAGSDLYFKPGASLQIGLDNWENWDWRGQLTALGSESQPIRFSADSGLPGGWNGLLFSINGDTGGAESFMEHCVVERAVNNITYHECSSPDTLRWCTLAEASNTGLSLSSAWPLVANCDFQDNNTGILVANNSGVTVIGDNPALSNSFLGGGDWYLYNDGSAPVSARYNGWCTVDGFTPADRIHDQLDNPAKGLVSYLPVLAVDEIAIAATYNPGTETIRLEWCEVQGALSYTIHGSPTAAWPQNGTPLGTTTDTYLDLPVAGLGAKHFFFATAELASRGAGRSGGCR